MIRIKADASTEFIPFTGLFINLPAWRNENIRVARRTEGVSPVTNANDQRIRIVIIIRSILNLLFIKNKRLNTNRIRIIDVSYTHLTLRGIKKLRFRGSTVQYN